MILRAYVTTTTDCFYCGVKLEARVAPKADHRQRCPNDCASGLGSCPEKRLGSPRGIVNDTPCDTVTGHIRI